MRRLPILVASILIISTLSISMISNIAVAQVQEEDVDRAKMEALLHWAYISAGDLNGLAMQYSEDAELYWIGGPLHGLYMGSEEIMGVWSRFIAGNEARFVFIRSVSASAVGDKIVVFADVVFHLRRAGAPGVVELDLSYILVFEKMDDMLKIMEEWWIIESARSLGG